MRQEMLSYDVEDIGEFCGAEFKCTVWFYAYEVGYKWAIEVRHVDLYELVEFPTRCDNGTVRTRHVAERRDCPAWMQAVIARNYHNAMVAEAEIAQADARYTDSGEADARRDEIVDREMQGAM